MAVIERFTAVIDWSIMVTGRYVVVIERFVGH